MTADAIVQKVVLVALLQKAGSKGRIRSFLAKKSCLNLLEILVPGSAGQQIIIDNLARLVDRGAAQEQRKRYEPTPSGKDEAFAFLGVRSVPTTLRWDDLAKRYLFPLALGIAKGLPDTARKQLATSEGRLAAVLCRELELGLGPVPTLAATKEALGWRLLERGGDPRLIERARKSNPKFAAGTVLDILTLSRAGVSAFAKDRGLEVLAASVTGANATGSDALQLAVLRRLADTARTPASGGDTADFATHVLSAAREVTTGRFGDNLVLVSHVWQALREQGDSLGLDDFKANLLEAYLANTIVLSKADMPQTLNPEDLSSSSILHGSRELVFIQLPGDHHE